MVYKYIDEDQVQQFNGVLKVDGLVMTGQSEEKAKRNGYKELVIDEQPTVESNQYLTTNYEDTETLIIQHWTIETITLPLAEAQDRKIAEMSDLCQETIYNGFDTVLSDGMSYHFSLDEHDQAEIESIALAAKTGENMFDKTDDNGVSLYSYHANDNNCKYYYANDILTIYQSGKTLVYSTKTYFNSLKNYIRGLTDSVTVVKLIWGVEIPEEYQSEPYKDLLAKQGVQNATA